MVIMIKKHTSITILLVCLLLFMSSGCGYNESQQRIYDAGQSVGKESGKAESPVQQEVNGLLKNYQGTEESALLSQTVSLSPKELAAVADAADALMVAYPYSDISGVAAAYERYQTLPFHQDAAMHGIVTSLPYTPETLFEIVRANNAAYFETYPSAKHARLDDDYIFWTCEIICDTLNRELPALGSNVISANVDANLADLKISKSPGASLDNGTLTNDNCMYLNPIMLQNMISLYGEHADDMTVTHETEHIIQKLSTETRTALGIERGYGFCITWEGQPVNSLYYNWFIESSAERLAAYLHECDPLTYKPMIGYLDSLTLLNVLNGGGVKETPKLTQQSSLELVFELFGIKTEDERLEFLNMFYAIEVIQTEPDDFMALYAEHLGHEVSEGELIQLKIQLKNAVCQTLSKYFYRNLSRLLAENQMTLRELFYLITVFEYDLHLHITYSDESRSEAIRPFMENYTLLQQTLFDSLGERLGLMPEELYESFTAFHYRTELSKDTILRGKAEWHSLWIEPLNQEANDFLYEFSRSVMIKKTVPVRAMANILY